MMIVTCFPMACADALRSVDQRHRDDGYVPRAVGKGQPKMHHTEGQF